MPRLERHFRGKRFRLIGMGSEASVWEVSNTAGKRKKGTVFRTAIRKKADPYVVRRFLMMRIAHLLFPENVIQVTELDAQKNRIRSKFSPPDKLLEDSQRIHIAYRRMTRRKLKTKQEIKTRDMLGARAEEREDLLAPRVASPEVQAALARLKHAGIHIDQVGWNISIRDPTKPKFYEVDYFEPEVLHKYIQTHTGLSEKKRALALQLLEEYQQVPTAKPALRIGARKK